MTKDEILEYFKDTNHYYNDCTRFDTLKRMLDELTEPKTGQWLDDGCLTCSNCGCIVYPFEIENGDYNFCPTCGSRNE